MNFKVRGPLDIPHWKLRGGRSIDSACAIEFFGWYPHLRTAKGVYVFGMRFGAKVRPYYVGKATKTFGQEVFAPTKLVHYNHAMANQKLGTPCLFLVVAPRHGATPQLIGHAERELIRMAAQANPNLCNKVGIKPPRWAIQGVIRGNAGGKSASAKAFAKTFGLDG